MLSRASLQRQLGWSAIDEDVTAEHEVWFHVRPTHSGLAGIDLLLDESRTWVTQMTFGNWHSYPDDLEEAIASIRLLIRGERCIVEQLDAAGRYRRGGVCERTGLPTTLHQSAAALRRVFFDREPEKEVLDRTRYFVGKAGLVLLEHKAEVERLYRESGMPEPEW